MGPRRVTVSSMSGSRVDISLQLTSLRRNGPPVLGVETRGGHGTRGRDTGSR